MAFSSRRALYAFAWAISARTGTYRCPQCECLERVVRMTVNQPKWTGIRQFGTTRQFYSQAPNVEEPEGDLIEFQLLNRNDDGSRISAQLPILDPTHQTSQESGKWSTKNLAELQQIETGLEMTKMSIEELEDALMDVNPAEVPFIGDETVQDDFQPWYLRKQGGISEDEYESINALLNSNPTIHNQISSIRNNVR